MTTAVSSGAQGAEVAHADGHERARGVRSGVQKFGTFLSSMVMPNIGAFIAWGLVTALFIPDGFFPNETIGAMVSPMVTYMLPLLIAYQGGKLVYGMRGGVVGAIATMGVIVGTDIPMFLGAMICGPLAAWCMKKIDGLWDGKIKPGFEMLVNNFAAGIFGAIAAVIALYVLTPVVDFLMHWAAVGVGALVDHNLLFLTSALIEPAKVLFLNNAINHGVLTPLAATEVAEQGKSILYLLEANPGPGLGVLLAYWAFGRGNAKATAPGAALIHFFGGIHEIYFPYVLMKPQLIISTIVGGMSAIAVESAFHVGLRGPAAPGSILAIYAMSSQDSYLGITLGVITATVVSFLISAVLLRTGKQDDGDLDAAQAKMQDMKGNKSAQSTPVAASASANAPVRNIVFACDAGMGSSAMGASVLRNKIREAGFDDVTVVNKAINTLSDDYDMVVVHQDLLDRAAPRTPSAQHVAVDNFMGSPRYDEIVDLIASQHNAGAAPAAAGAAATPTAAGAAGAAATTAATGAAAAPAAAGAAAAAPEDPAGSEVLTPETIVLSGRARTRDEAIEEAGQLLMRAGAVDRGYVDSMFKREESVSTFMGNGLAIPHGTNDAKNDIKKSAISFVRYDNPIDWNGKEATFVVGIAGSDGSHLKLLSKLAKAFGNKETVAKLSAAQSEEEIIELLGKVNG